MKHVQSNNLLLRLPSNTNEIHTSVAASVLHSIKLNLHPTLD